MKARQLLMALILGLALTVPAAPGSQAMPERPAVGPGLLTLAAPAQLPAADPAPTAGAPPAPVQEGVPETAVPEEIANVPGVTGDWWAEVQEQVRSDMCALAPDRAAAGGPAYRDYYPAPNAKLALSAGGLHLIPAPLAPDPMVRTTAAEAGPGWRWELRVISYGDAEHVRSQAG
jgi:hypothetical protein